MHEKPTLFKNIVRESRGWNLSERNQFVIRPLHPQTSGFCSRTKPRLIFALRDRRNAGVCTKRGQTELFRSSFISWWFCRRAVNWYNDSIRRVFARVQPIKFLIFFNDIIFFKNWKHFLFQDFFSLLRTFNKTLAAELVQDSVYENFAKLLKKKNWCNLSRIKASCARKACRLNFGALHKFNYAELTQCRKERIQKLHSYLFS